MVNANFIKTLTPDKAWEYFVCYEVNLFLSCFNKAGITDIKTMCETHASGLTKEFLLTTKQIEKIAFLLEKHINEFIDTNGGYKLYTAKEIEEIDKKEKEEEAAKILKNDLPEPLNDKFYELFKEYHEQKTPEAKFVKAIDGLDPAIHELDYKEDWKGWTKEFLIDKKEHLFEDFPELKKVFYELLEFMEKENYFE